MEKIWATDHGKDFQEKLFQLSATAFLILNHSFSTKNSVEEPFKVNMFLVEKIPSYWKTETFPSLSVRLCVPILIWASHVNLEFTVPQVPVSSNPFQKKLLVLFFKCLKL